MDDFYFAYGYNAENKTADRLYRYINQGFERYDLNEKKWGPSPEQCCIFAGEDWDYDEITEKQALEIIKNINI